MKCILHIGTEKTGTSSLQKFLQSNRKTLARHGYGYLKSAGLPNNRMLPLAAYDPTREDEFTRYHGLGSSEELVAFQGSIGAALKKELLRMPDVHTVVFSSEFLQSRLRTASELLRLRQILDAIGFKQFEVLVYLRHPVEIANSLYTTAIKTGGVKATPPEPDNDYWQNVCNHRSTLLRFSEVFGADSITPRIYSKLDLINGTIVDDFAAAVGTPGFPDEYTLPRPQNESMTVLGLEILRRVNSRVALAVASGDQKTSALQNKATSLIVEHFKEGERYGMPSELREKYESAFRASNDWVRSEYFPDRKYLFDEAQIPLPTESKLNSTELDQIANVIASTLIETLDSRSLRSSLFSSRASLRLNRLKSKVLSVVR